jgi:hypothetical protein
MHVLYIRESSDDGFHLFLVYNFRFNKSFVFDEIPIDTHTVVELTIHNNSKFDAIINKAYYIPNSDFDMQQYQGNNLQLTISPKPNDGFMIETVIGETTSDIVLYDEVTKTNWSALPIVGFDDVKLPTEN